MPFAVSTGWSLGAPAAEPSLVGPPVGSAGGIGAAPTPGWTSKPVTAVEYPTRPAEPSASVTSFVPHRPARVNPSPSRPESVTSRSASPVPSLTEPPVPTPTEIEADIPSDSPSATPSGGATSQSSHVDATRLVPRP